LKKPVCNFQILTFFSLIFFLGSAMIEAVKKMLVVRK